MINYNVSYFEKAGNHNIDDVIDISVNAAKELGIKKIAIFSARMSSVLKLKQEVADAGIEIIVTTYAYGRKFKIKNNDSGYDEITPEVATKELKEIILKEGMHYIQGGVPLEPIISNTGDNSMEMIITSLELFSTGMTLCVNASIMAYENGYIEDGENIIAISGDTAIVAKPSNKRDFLCGDFKIHRILCKPL
jgi:hypothetical protein